MDGKALRAAVKIYDVAWKIFMPALRASSRLKEGYSGRSLEAELARADLWIQAASGGEAYLAWQLVSSLSPESRIKVLVTTNTRQGMDILEKAAGKINSRDSFLTLVPGWFPFDSPSIMDAAVSQVRPGLVVLLETEIWPGLLYALKSRGVPCGVINGRITRKSFSGYKKAAGLLRALCPDFVLAVSAQDAQRFAYLFGRDRVFEMPNMKFDRLAAESPAGRQTALGPEIVGPGAGFLVLGSVRKEEEEQIKKLILHVRNCHPGTVIGLFPRHMHRTGYWRRELDRAEIPWSLRSELSSAARPGSVILWDIFGELAGAYRSADAVFVGGTLAPLGGQNFLEPLICGCRPVIGPYWDNFAWAGQELFKQGLVITAPDWRAAAEKLCCMLETPDNRDRIRKQAEDYIGTKSGGTETARRLVEKYLGRPSAG